MSLCSLDRQSTSTSASGSLYVFPSCPIMATLPSALPSGNVSCHRELIHLRALFIDTRARMDHTHTPTPPSCRPPPASSLRLTVASPAAQLPHLHLLTEKVTLATWPAIWRGLGGYPKQAKHNPITPQGDTPHLLNSAWVIFCFSSGACKDPLTRLWSTTNENQQMSDKVSTPAVWDCYNQEKAV